MSNNDTKRFTIRSADSTKVTLPVYDVIVIPSLIPDTGRGPRNDPRITVQWTSYPDSGGASLVQARVFPTITVASMALSLVGLPITVDDLGESFSRGLPISTLVSPQFCAQYTIGDRESAADSSPTPYVAD
jgi:hypothetical protein